MGERPPRCDHGVPIYYACPCCDAGMSWEDFVALKYGEGMVRVSRWLRRGS
jgi:hypothetical protein